jgi:hypothetical protein
MLRFGAPTRYLCGKNDGILWILLNKLVICEKKGAEAIN